jgi:hypothetical protein
MDVQLDGRWIGVKKKSTCLHNEMDAREGHSLNRCDICGQRGHNRKTCETR